MLTDTQIIKTLDHISHCNNNNSNYYCQKPIRCQIGCSKNRGLSATLLFTYLMLAVLGLHSCVAFSNHRRWGYSLVAVWGLLIVVASLVAEHEL